MGGHRGERDGALTSTAPVALGGPIGPVVAATRRAAIRAGRRRRARRRGVWPVLVCANGRMACWTMGALRRFWAVPWLRFFFEKDGAEGCAGPVVVSWSLDNENRGKHVRGGARSREGTAEPERYCLGCIVGNHRLVFVVHGSTP